MQALQAANGIDSNATQSTREAIREAIRYLDVADLLASVLEIHGESGNNIASAFVIIGAQTPQPGESIDRNIYAEAGRRLIALGWADPSDVTG